MMRGMTLSLIPLAALALPDAAEPTQPPDWVHLVPRGVFQARDGRGPWRYGDAGAVIQRSFAAIKTAPHRFAVHRDQARFARACGAKNGLRLG